MKTSTGRGFTLIELMAASAIAMIIFSLFVGTYHTVLQHYAMSELPQRGDQIATAMYYYYLDTGTYPTGTDAAGLANLVSNNAGVAGWRGPYLRLEMGDGTIDPWGRPFLYRRGITPSGQAVFLLLSLGRNGRLDSSLSHWTNPNWDVSGDDWGRVFSERAPISFYEERTYNTLRFTAGMIYNASPTSPPSTFDTSRYLDAWGRPVIYRPCNPYSAVVYSLGANGQDNSTNGTAICSSARKQLDDIYVALTWADERDTGGNNNDDNDENCSRWLPPPWQPTAPNGSDTAPPWQDTSPSGGSAPPGRPWRDPNMPCRGVDDRCWWHNGNCLDFELG